MKQTTSPQDILDNPLVWFLESGYLLMEMSRFGAAEDVFAGVSQLYPDNEVPHIATGHLLFAIGKFHAAIKSYQAALALNPQSADAMAGWGESLLFLKKPTEAIPMLEKVIAMQPQSKTAKFAEALLDAYNMNIFGK